MNRWVVVGLILAFIMLPTLFLPVELCQASNSLLATQQTKEDINNTTPTTLPSNSTTPNVTPPQTRTIPAGQLVALTASIIVALACLWICFKKPNPTKTEKYNTNLKNQSRQHKKSRNSPQALKTRFRHSSHQPLKPLVLRVSGKVGVAVLNIRGV